jgi:hypothetical protein
MKEIQGARQTSLVSTEGGAADAFGKSYLSFILMRLLTVEHRIIFFSRFPKVNIYR